MNEFFHVCKTSELTIDNKFELKRIEDIGRPISGGQFYSKEEFTQQLIKLYPDGISKHGETYLYNTYPIPKDQEGNDYVAYLPMIETTFEMVRRASYTEQPSRFVCVFGCLSKDDANKLISTTFGGEGVIYKVSCATYYKKDMSLLSTGGSFGGNMILADKYWQGLSSQDPFWEVLMVPPVKVIKKVL